MNVGTSFMSAPCIAIGIGIGIAIGTDAGTSAGAGAGAHKHAPTRMAVLAEAWPRGACVVIAIGFCPIDMGAIDKGTTNGAAIAESAREGVFTCGAGAGAGAIAGAIACMAACMAACVGIGIGIGFCGVLGAGTKAEAAIA